MVLMKTMVFINFFCKKEEPDWTSSWTRDLKVVLMEDFFFLKRYPIGRIFAKKKFKRKLILFIGKTNFRKKWMVIGIFLFFYFFIFYYLGFSLYGNLDYMEFRYGDGKVFGTQPHSTSRSASTHCVPNHNLIKGSSNRLF